jgi:hypothetical protein
MWDADFFTSDYGQWLLSARRSHRRIYLQINGLEPRSKSAMPVADSIAFRGTVREQLKARRRRPHRGPVVLTLRLRTSAQNPGHIHTITKNLLDLLGTRPEASGSCRGLLYNDDSQIHGLVVSCEHGANEPSIFISSRSLGDFRQELAAVAYGKAGTPQWHDLADEDRLAASWSEKEKAQRTLLGDSRLRIRDLAHLFRAIDQTLPFTKQLLDDLAERGESHLLEQPFRITVGEPPRDVGSSLFFRSQLSEAVAVFRERFKRLLTPLLIPVALEVVVKPPRSSTAHGVHDLDNLLRRYLIPVIVETFQPPSHFLWALERHSFDSLGIRQPLLQTRTRGRLPQSAAIGLIRIEAWRVPRTEDDNTPGFVSLALVADDFGYRDSVSSVDRMVDAWADSLR